jgi:ADP-ribose pyrophosphatase
LLEIPAGKLEEGESPEACAVRELEEETGFRAGKIRRILEYFPSPGFSDERIHLFEAAELQKGKKNLQPDELVETVFLSVSELVKLIKEGKMRDSKTIIAVLAVTGEFFRKRDSSLHSE